MMIYLNQNLHQKLRIHSVLIGKLLIQNHRQKSMDPAAQIVLHIQILIVVDIGKDRILVKYLD
jgi:hypothetical protein